MNGLESSRITAFHDGQAAAAPSEVWRAIQENHRLNDLLWKEEDLARRRHVPDSEIAGNKRAIDRYNQQRNDSIEQIDETLLKSLSIKENSRLSSETPGAIVDRLSILSLKIHHMRLQTRRKDVDRAHIEGCAAKLDRLTEQRTDLAFCFDRLLAECARGEARFKIYRQFKMYNDPALNPSIYDEHKRT